MSSSRIERIAREAGAAFSKGITGQDFTNRFDTLVNSVGQLRASDVNLVQSLVSVSQYIREISPPCYNIDVFSSETFAITISILNDGRDFPLHNTPGMYCIVKVIEGFVEISSYTAVADDNANIVVPEDVKAQVCREQRDKVEYIPVNKHKPMRLGENNEPCILRPQEGNFHEISNESYQAAYIKVLAPPYDMVNRVCTFYIAPQTAEKDAAVKTFLVKSCPHNFNSFTLPYCGPQIDVNV